MKFPETLDELKSRGYEFSDHGTCWGCGDAIEWWKTPSGKSMPFNPMERGSSPALTHFTTCTEADSFRKAR